MKNYRKIVTGLINSKNNRSWKKVITDVHLSLLIFVPLLVSLVSLFLSLLISLSFSSLSTTLSIKMTMIARPVGSLCTHGPVLPEGQSAGAMAHSLLVRLVRIMQETSVQVFLCKPRTTWNEVGLCLCWKEKCAWYGVVDCAVCFCACWYVLICDVVCCHRLWRVQKTLSIIAHKSHHRDLSPLRFKLILKQ